MKKIDLTNVQEFTDFRRPVGGFILEIKGCVDDEENERLKVSYDIVQAYDPNDAEFVGMYTQLKKDKGWDYPTTIVSYKAKALSFFKGFITAIKESNNGYDFSQTWNEKELVGKRFGCTLGSAEYMGKAKDGSPKVKIRTNVVDKRSVQSILDGDFTMPELKKLDQSAQKPANNSPFANVQTEETPQEAPNPFEQVENVDDVPF